MITELNYAAALELARKISRRTYRDWNRVSGWENPENHVYWEVREAIPAAVRARGLRFLKVISGNHQIGSFSTEEELRELANPVWAEIAGQLLFEDIHTL